MLAVVDAGPLYATADADDDHHEARRRVLSRGDLRLVVPALVVAEATYLVGRRLGAVAEAAFLTGVGTLDVEGPAREDFTASPSSSSNTRTSRSAVPTPRSSHSPSASERIVITLDRRHFAAISAPSKRGTPAHSSSRSTTLVGFLERLAPVMLEHRGPVMR